MHRLKIVGLGVVLALAMVLTAVLSESTTGNTPQASAAGGCQVAYQQAWQFQPVAYNYYDPNTYPGQHWFNNQQVLVNWQPVSGQLTNGQFVYGVQLYGFWMNNYVSWCVAPGPFYANYNVNYFPRYINVGWYNGYLQPFVGYNWYNVYYAQVRGAVLVTYNGVNDYGRPRVCVRPSVIPC